MTATKFIAACLRLFAFGNFVSLLFAALSALGSRGVGFGQFCLVFGTWAAAAFLLFVYAIPLARFLATDID